MSRRTVATNVTEHLPRGNCFICGHEHSVRADGYIRRHRAAMYCGQYEDEHDHNLCVRRYGPAIAAYVRSPGRTAACLGSGMPPESVQATWNIMVMASDHTWSTHFAHPNRAPVTSSGSIWNHSSNAISAMHFPVDAADEWAEGPIVWRTVCAPLDDQAPGSVLIAFLCFEDPPRNDLAGVRCSACRRWANTTRRWYRYNNPADNSA